MIQGKNLLVYIQGDGINGDTDEVYPIGCDKNCDLTTQSDFLETTVKDNGYWKTVLPTTLSYQLTGDGLADYSRTVGLPAMQLKIGTRKIISWKMIAEDNLGNECIYSGVGYLQVVGSSGPVEGSMTYNYSIIGTGAYDIDNNIPNEGGGGTPVDDMANIYPLYFRTTTDQTSYQNDILVGASLVLFSIEQVIIFKDDDQGLEGESNWDGFDPATGTVTWLFTTENKSRGYIIYKK